LLAHAFLANGDPDRIVGQLCGDFVRGSDLSAYPPTIQLGIACHRAVDSYTDRHPENLVARNLFERPYRRFAGITVDVIYDYFLAANWNNYSDVSLEEYTELVVRSLQSRYNLLPAGLQRFLDLIRAENTLLQNRNREHIELTLARISLRRKSMAPLATVAGPMWQQEARLKISFDRFFPQLVSYTTDYKNKLESRNYNGG